MPEVQVPHTPQTPHAPANGNGNSASDGNGNGLNSEVRQAPEQTFFLTEVLGWRVTLDGKKIGKLSDFVIVDKGKIAEVTHVYVTRSFGYHSLLIPWEKVKSMENGEVKVSISKVEDFEGQPDENAVLLKDHILDKKVLDSEDREVEVVYDVKLAVKNGRLYVSDVDLSRYGLLRRIGLKWLANFVYSLADKIKSQTIAWTYVQPLPTNLTTFRGDIKLSVLKERLSDMQPVDLADVLEEMEHEQRVKIFEELDPERASDTLEEINPNVQRELVSSLKKEKVVQLINEMTSGQAADILSVLPWNDKRQILKLLNEDHAVKIKAILSKQEENVASYTTKSFLKISPDETVEQVRKNYHKLAKGKKVIMYLYVVGEKDKLLGVIDIKELLMAKEDALTKDIMVADVITLKPRMTLKQASMLFSRYDFRAIPLTDKNGRIVGVVPFRDVMNLTHHFIE